MHKLKIATSIAPTLDFVEVRSSDPICFWAAEQETGYFSTRMTKTQKLFLAGIVVLAVFFRFYKISEMPGGLFPDEAANGLDINLMQQGRLQPFYERGNGREALFFYMEWASASVFGVGHWQFHIVSAGAGVLAVVLCFLFTRRLFLLDGDDEPNRNRAVNIALLAAFLMAASTWHTVLSRTAFRANLIPLFTTLTLYLLLAAYQSPTFKRRLLFAFLTGASFALGFYTYIAYRIMVPILFMVLAWPLLATIKQRAFWATVKGWLAPAMLFIVAFAIFFYPLGHYFYTHKGSFIGRSGQVSIFNQTLYTIDGEKLTAEPTVPQVALVLGEVVKRSVLAFFTGGDLNWRHNISGFPFLSPLVSPFFGAGLAAAALLGTGYFFMPLKKRQWWKFFLLTGWFWGMLLPVATTAEGIPHGLRSIGMIPAVFILSAWAIYVFIGWFMKLHRRLYETWAGFESWQYKITTRGFAAVAVVFVAAVVSQAYVLYFVYAYNEPSNFYYFRSDLASVSKYLNERGSKNSTYLVLDKFSVQSTDYLTTVDGGHPDNGKNRPYIQVDPENSWQLNLRKGDQVVFTQSSIFDIAKFKQHHPEARLAIEERNKFDQAVMAVYKVY